MIHIRYEFLCVMREVTLPKIKNKMVSAITCLEDKHHVKGFKKVKMDVFTRKGGDKTQKIPWETGRDTSYLPALHNYLNF